ncbi:MAG: MTH1187 family thiamine-binding protein [Candidatus Micrarchaeia archaeon]
MIVAEASIVPLGSGTSVSSFVAAFVKSLRRQGIRTRPHAMGTNLECASLGRLFRAVERAREEVFSAGARRVLLTLHIDERRDKRASIAQKLRSLKQKI